MQSRVFHFTGGSSKSQPLIDELLSAIQIKSLKRSKETNNPISSKCTLLPEHTQKAGQMGHVGLGVNVPETELPQESSAPL